MGGTKVKSVCGGINLLRFAAIILVVGFFFLFFSILPSDKIEDRLPKAAKNIQEVGNRWYLFDIEINGETHQFLYSNRGITEIKNEKSN